jgi:hypothetical protein
MKRAPAIRQIHARVSADLKKAIKMFCARAGTTEQSWIHALIQAELHRKAPDLWSPQTKEGSPVTQAKRQ